MKYVLLFENYNPLLDEKFWSKMPFDKLEKVANKYANIGDECLQKFIDDPSLINDEHKYGYWLDELIETNIIFGEMTDDGDIAEKTMKEHGLNSNDKSERSKIFRKYLNNNNEFKEYYIETLMNLIINIDDMKKALGETGLSNQLSKDTVNVLKKI
jgi:hypothetical protein